MRHTRPDYDYTPANPRDVLLFALVVVGVPLLFLLAAEVA